MNYALLRQDDQGRPLAAVESRAARMRLAQHAAAMTTAAPSLPSAPGPTTGPALVSIGPAAAKAWWRFDLLNAGKQYAQTFGDYLTDPEALQKAKQLYAEQASYGKITVVGEKFLNNKWVTVGVMAGAMSGLGQAPTCYASYDELAKFAQVKGYHIYHFDTPATDQPPTVKYLADPLARPFETARCGFVKWLSEEQAWVSDTATDVELIQFLSPPLPVAPPALTPPGVPVAPPEHEAPPAEAAMGGKGWAYAAVAGAILVGWLLVRRKK